MTLSHDTKESTAPAVPLVTLAQHSAFIQSLHSAYKCEDLCEIVVSAADTLLESRRAVLVLADGEQAFKLHAWRGFKPAFERFSAADEKTLTQSVVELLGESHDIAPFGSSEEALGALAVSESRSKSDPEVQHWQLATLAQHFEIALKRLTGGHAAPAQPPTEDLSRPSGKLAHDVRSCLNGLSLQLEMLASEMLGPLSTEQQESVEMARTGVRNISELMKS